MKRTTLGKFPLNGRDFTVIVNPDGTGGSFDVDAGTIEIGLYYDSWQEVCNILLHEVVEATLVQMDLRYRPSIDVSAANDSYLFVMNHRHYSESIARASTLISTLIGPLEAHYKRLKKRPSA